MEELNTEFYLITRGNENITYFIYSSGNRLIFKIVSKPFKHLYISQYIDREKQKADMILLRDLKSFYYFLYFSLWIDRY